MTSNLEAPTLAWDLSGKHAAGRVDWPGERTALAVEGGVRATVAFPAGKAFDEAVARVMCRRRGDTVADIDFFFPPEETADAYRRMTRLGEEWDIDTRRIDAWFSRRLAQREWGAEDRSDTVCTSDLDAAPLGGPGGPLPVIEALSSFDESRPVIVSLSFTWPDGGLWPPESGT